MVPALVYAFTTTGTEHAVAMALGTSMAAIVVSAAQSAYGHYRRGSTCAGMIRRITPWVVVGVAFGSAVAAKAPPVPLLSFVACFQLFAAALMMTDVSKLAALQILARRDLADFRWHCGARGDWWRNVVYALFQGCRHGAEARDRHVGCHRTAGEPGRRHFLRVGRP
jgi:uncharacterized membrane protein YfcA